MEPQNPIDTHGLRSRAIDGLTLAIAAAIDSGWSLEEAEPWLTLIEHAEASINLAQDAGIESALGEAIHRALADGLPERLTQAEEPLRLLAQTLAWSCPTRFTPETDDVPVADPVETQALCDDPENSPQASTATTEASAPDAPASDAPEGAADHADGELRGMLAQLDAIAASIEAIGDPAEAEAPVPILEQDAEPSLEIDPGEPQSPPAVAHAFDVSPAGEPADGNEAAPTPDALAHAIEESAPPAYAALPEETTPAHPGPSGDLAHPEDDVHADEPAPSGDRARESLSGPLTLREQDFEAYRRPNPIEGAPGDQVDADAEHPAPHISEAAPLEPAAPEATGEHTERSPSATPSAAIETAVAGALEPSGLDGAADAVRAAASAIRDTSYAALPGPARVAVLLDDIAAALPLPDASFADEIIIRLCAVQALMQGVEDGVDEQGDWPLDTLESRVRGFLRGEALAPEMIGVHAFDVERLCMIDDIVTGAPSPTGDDLGAEDTEEWGTVPVALPAERMEQLQFAVSELCALVPELSAAAQDALNQDRRAVAVETIVGVTHRCRTAIGDFQFVSLEAIFEVLISAAEVLPVVSETCAPELIVRLRGLVSLIEQHATGLSVGMEQRWPLRTLKERVAVITHGGKLHPDIVGWHRGDPERALELDTVTEGVETPPRPEQHFDPEAPPGEPIRPTADEGSHSAAAHGPIAKVPFAALDAIQDTSRRLVLGKNRLRGICAEIQAGTMPAASAVVAALEDCAGDFDQLLGDLQMTLTRLRLERVDKVFDRYHRVVRDVARLNDREAELEIVGGETLVERALVERMIDPINDIIRYCVRRGIEPIEQRVAEGKEPAGRLVLGVVNCGSHIRVVIEHDGRSPEGSELDPDALFATELQDAGATLRAIGAITAIDQRPGEGVRIAITAPVTSAVTAAMIVEVDGAEYALPLSAIREIVRPDHAGLSSVRGHPVLRVRGQIIPALDIAALLRRAQQDARSMSNGRRVALVVEVGESTCALVADRVIGQEEIVIEALDNDRFAGVPFSGATIGPAGGVRLILDLWSIARQIGDVHQLQGAA